MSWNVSYIGQVHFYWVAIWVLPVVFGAIAWRVCGELRASERVVAQRRQAEAEARLARIKRA